MRNNLSKRNFIGYVLLISVGIVIFTLVFRKNYNDERLGQEYMNSFKLNFSGIVEDKSEITGNNGILYLKNVRGINKNYDPRDSLDYYCCIVIGDKAEIIIGGMRLYEVGDSVYINGNENIALHYRNNELIQKINISMNRFGPLYNSAKKLHRLGGNVSD